MNRHVFPRFGIAAIVLACMGLLVPGATFQARADELNVVPVAAVKAVASDYQPKLTLSGSIAARSLVNVSFRLNGQLVQAEVNFARQKALLAQGFTTRSTYDQATQNLQTTQSALASAESQLNNARDELSYTELQAPVSGVITARNVEAGQVVQAAQTAFSIAEDGPRDAVFDVQETLVNHAKIGMGVTISLLSDASISAEGKIREISPVVDAQTGTVRVKVGIAQTPHQMALGATVTGTVHMESVKVVVLPWSAMTSDAGRTAVWRLSKDSKVATLVPIKVLAYEKGRLLVESGLQEGELIVTKGAQMLRSGEPAEIMPEQEGLVAQ